MCVCVCVRACVHARMCMCACMHVHVINGPFGVCPSVVIVRMGTTSSAALMKELYSERSPQDMHALHMMIVPTLLLHKYTQVTDHQRRKDKSRTTTVSRTMCVIF